MANNPDSQRESYHEVPAKKYIFLFETAIHKRFFFYWTIILWLATWIITRFIGLDYMIWAWHVQNWWIAFPYAAIIAGAILLWRHEVLREARQREKNAEWVKKYPEIYPQPEEVKKRK